MSSSQIAETVRNVAIAGNPNCGKSTIFNALTGMRQKVGNYPGVTVERKVGRFHGSHGEPMTLLDLPGSYSLQIRSPDEAVARDVLLGRRDDTPRPDVIVAVVDASNLERNLYLVGQLLDLQLPTILVLNMVDVAEENGIRLDIDALQEELGIPVIPAIASKGVGLIELKQALSRTPLPAPRQRAPLPAAIEREAEELAARLSVTGVAADASFPEALLLLTQHDEALVELVSEGLTSSQTVDATLAAQSRLREEGIEPLSAVVEARYEWIADLCRRVARKQEGEEYSLTLSDKLDAYLTHRFWGWAAFLCAMALVFFCIFTVADIPMGWIEDAQAWAGNWVTENMAESDLRSLLADGVIQGVGNVVVFLPQILILFFFLGLLEDSGYMARAAFMMDRLMSSVGLHGKSFIPLLSSVACAIPGIMATRTVENRKDRLVTILVAPLMSCSARLPVYTLMIAVLLPASSAWAKAGIVISMYFLGAFAAFGMAWLFKKTLLRGETPMLLLELPPYRRPSLKTIVHQMLERAGVFLKRAGSVILALSILLWALATYPKPTDPDMPASQALAQSYAGRLGHLIEPTIRPLGYDWKIGVGLIGSFAARELFVGTMGIVYNVEGDVEEDVVPLRETMRAETHADGSPVYTPLVCLGIMVFYVLAMQCISTVAIVRRETNSWRWPLFQLGYMTGLAWVAAFLVLHVGRLFGFQ